MKVISIANIKGGVGKTLTTINLAGQLSQNGYKVLIIDNDSQSNVTQILNIEDPEITLYDIYSDKKIGIDDCIYEVSENLYVVPNSICSSKLELNLASKMNRESILKMKFNTIPKVFDFVLIDNSPFLGILTQNALVISHYLLAVVDNSSSSLQGLNMLNEVKQEIEDAGLNENIIMLGILRNRLDKNTRFTKDFNEVLKINFKDSIFDTIIYNSVKYKEASAMHKTIQEYDKKYAEPYKELVKEIEKKLIR